MRTYNVSIISPCPAVRAGLELLLEQEEGFTVSGKAGNYEDAMQLVNKSNSDIVVADISLRYWGDIGLIKDIRKQNASLPILVYSACDEDLYAGICIRLGAKGYIMANESVEKTMEAIRTVSKGGSYFSDSVAKKLDDPVNLLTERQFEVFILVGQLYSCEEIARIIGRRPGTVKAHMKDIRGRLRLKRFKLRKFAASYVLLNKCLPQNEVKA